jgi:hypothetical protein
MSFVSASSGKRLPNFTIGPEGRFNEALLVMQMLTILGAAYFDELVQNDLSR